MALIENFLLGPVGHENGGKVEVGIRFRALAMVLGILDLEIRICILCIMCIDCESIYLVDTRETNRYFKLLVWEIALYCD